MTTCHHLTSPFIAEATLNHFRCPAAPTQEISPPTSDSSLTPSLRLVKVDLLPCDLDDEPMTPPEEEGENGREAPSIATPAAPAIKMTTVTTKTTVTTATATTTTTAKTGNNTTTSPPSKPKRACVRFNLPDQVESGSSESESEPNSMWNSSSNDDVSVRTLTPDSEISSPSSSSLDILGQRVSTEILVALLDRPSEMQELVQRNPDYFTVIKGFLSRAPGQWEKFLELVHAPREVVGDSEWLEGIKRFIESCPPYFEKFKQIVGYDDSLFGCDDQDDYEYDDYEDEDDENDRDASSDDGDDDDDDDDDDDRYSEAAFEDVDLTLMRRLPSRFATFERSYPQFFVNVRTSFCSSRSNPPLRRGPVADPELTPDTGRAESRFDEFVRILFTPRHAMADAAWESALLKCLKGWPNLLAQLKEIVAYEIEDGWENGEMEDDEDECEMSQ